MPEGGKCLMKKHQTKILPKAGKTNFSITFSLRF